VCVGEGGGGIEEDRELVEVVEDSGVKVVVLLRGELRGRVREGGRWRGGGGQFLQKSHCVVHRLRYVVDVHRLPHLRGSGFHPPLRTG